ncbi:MAG TPA: hypothetical protein VN695_09565 [Streptosporangiaceae bacterium]|nr:hypothetical protein [Streptosporangiaceae bacterium]
MGAREAAVRSRWFVSLPHRRIPLRTALLALAVAIAVLTAATARLFLWPAQGLPGKVSAIVMLAGPGDLLSRAVDLARTGRAPFLVISLGKPQSGNQCPPRIPGVKLVCFNPVPASTQGEAEFVGRLARRHDWRSVALVTITPQDTRARLRIERCFPGRVYVVTAPPDPTQTNWPYQIVYQWGALFKALILQRSC